MLDCMAYIDLNPLRAGLVERPEEYRWNSLGYHIQTHNKGDFLSLDFGLRKFGVLDTKERLKRYRRHVYEAGALYKVQRPTAGVIDTQIIDKDRKHDFDLNRLRRFRYRTRYFSDSGIIGTKAFVSKQYNRFRDIFRSKHEKRPKLIKGLDGIYSLKRLSEV